MINCGQFIRKEARKMLRKTPCTQGIMRCRMPFSRACSVAEAFGLFAARFRMDLRS